MGHTEFLVSGGGSGHQSLQEAIEALRAQSFLFCRAFAFGDMQRAGKATNTAMQNLDFIVGELMRSRDDISNGLHPASPAFDQAMAVNCGELVTGVTTQDQMDVHASGPGNGRLPANLTAPKGCSLETVLNKVKHQNRCHMNFRIENGRHVFVVSAHRNRKPDCVVEFDVQQFCDLCDAADVAR